MQNLLSDEELLAAYQKVTPSIHPGLCNDFTPRLRAVQSAVLAKAEVEARERERTAFEHGVATERARLPFGDSRSWVEVIDRLYPSLRPPKTVTLSTGEWRRDADGYWLRGQSRHIAAEVATLDDAEKLAAYLRAEGK